jgi:hypothetical protein
MITRTTTTATRIFIHVSMLLVFCSIRRRSSFGSFVGVYAGADAQGRVPPMIRGRTVHE